MTATATKKKMTGAAKRKDGDKRTVYFVDEGGYVEEYDKRFGWDSKDDQETVARCQSEAIPYCCQVESLGDFFEEPKIPDNEMDKCITELTGTLRTGTGGGTIATIDQTDCPQFVAAFQRNKYWTLLKWYRNAKGRRIYIFWLSHSKR